MKKVLSIIMALSMIISSMAMTASADLVNPFEDVPSDAWYHDEVVKAVDTGIISGKSATIFAPDDLLTYAEAIKLAACMNQVYTDGEVTLSPGEPWYKPFVDYCKTKQIITKEYNYNDNVTRAGYMEIFANALPDEAFADINNIPDGSILDVKNNAPYAIYVYKLYRAGIVTGVDELHNCNPDDNIKRSEVAAIISRMMDEDKRVKFDMTESKGTLSNEGTIDSDED
ncbi:MAG: S-layer homology domain-containing protein [Clostridia bacterium]|nr:S-layer homology domain-containing protein [Clostridia bacterium]